MKAYFNSDQDRFEDFKTFFENSEKIFTEIDRNEFKEMFRSIVNDFKKNSRCSTPAAILATIGWLWFNDQQDMKREFSHTFLYNGEPVLVIFGDDNEQDGPVDLRLDFDFFDKVLGYRRRDVLQALRLYEQTKMIIASGMCA